LARTNDHGFIVPVIDESKCIGCGLCEKICPVINTSFSKKNYAEAVTAYAAHSRDDEIRYRSTSGGIFSEIAQHIITNKGGFVAGAIYNNDLNIVHYLTNDIEDISQLRQSKYVQSRKYGIYKQVKDILNSNNMVLFAGCPCEVAAMSNFIGGPLTDNLVLVDFICLGANSPYAYNKYLEYLQDKYKSEITGVWFKNKEKTWNRFCTRVDFKNGKHYLKDRYSDLYMRCYIEKQLIIRKSCESCHYKGIPHGSDLTMADFWGVEKVVEGIDSTIGVSLVYANTEKGRALIRQVEDKLYIHEVDLRHTYYNNPMVLSSVVIDSNADSFFKKLSGNSFKDAAYAFLPHGLLYDLKINLYAFKRHAFRKVRRK
jgi:coenzyme F420-reducing hydrogenase beta subunit